MNSASVMNSTFSTLLVPATTFPYIFEATGIPTDLICLIVARTFFGLIGILLNFSLVILIARNRPLHTSCSYFLALNALCTLFYELSYCITLGVVLSGVNSISLNVCFYFQSLSIFGANGSICFILFIGVDRMLCCSFPCWYKKGSKFYILCVINICFAYGAFAVFTCFLAVLKLQNVQVMCSVSELYVPEISTEMFRNNIILNGLTLCTYVIVWVVFTSRKAIKNDKANRRMLKSLTVVMLFVFFGWMLYSIARLVMPAFEFSNITTWYVNTVIGVIMSIAVASNAIVLYIFSKEYRKLFQIQNQRLAHALGLSKKKVMSENILNLNVSKVMPISKPLRRKTV